MDFYCISSGAALDADLAEVGMSQAELAVAAGLPDHELRALRVGAPFSGRVALRLTNALGFYEMPDWIVPDDGVAPPS